MASALRFAMLAALGVSSFALGSSIVEPAARAYLEFPSPEKTTVPAADLEHGRDKIARAQVPLQLCPEALGKPIQSCTACGGNSKAAGFCDNVSPINRHKISVLGFLTRGGEVEDTDV